MMKVLLLGHYSRTGKDTLANWAIHYTKEWGLTAKKVSFAWKLKEVTHQLYGWAGLREPEFYETPEGAKLRTVVLEPLGKTPIDIWVDFGTKAVRQQVYQDTWIDYVLNQDYRGVDLLVIPDARFFNEIEAFADDGPSRGWDVMHAKVLRAGFGPKDTESDLNLIDYGGWDTYFGGSMQDLKEQGEAIAMWAKGWGFPYQDCRKIAELKKYERKVGE
jgi:hypothetical protein